MKSHSPIALAILAAGFALAPAVQAEEMSQIFFVLYDDASVAAAQESAVPTEQAVPTDSDRQLESVREQIARDMTHD